MARVIRGADVRGAAVMQATDEARRLIEDAEAGASAIREAHMAGLRAEAAADAQAKLAAAHLTLEARYADERENLRAQVNTLAVAVASRVLSSEVTARPELIGAWVDEALRRVSRARSVTVRVHPDDVARLPEAAAATIEADPELARGDCVVESELGVIDGRLSVKLAALLHALEAK